MIEHGLWPSNSLLGRLVELSDTTSLPFSPTWRRLDGVRSRYGGSVWRVRFYSGYNRSPERRHERRLEVVRSSRGKAYSTTILYRKAISIRWISHDWFSPCHGLRSDGIWGSMGRRLNRPSAPNKALQRTRKSVGCFPWRSVRAAELGRYPTRLGRCGLKGRFTTPSRPPPCSLPWWPGPI